MIVISALTAARKYGSRAALAIIVPAQSLTMPTASPLVRSTFVAGFVVVSVRWHAAQAPEPAKRVEVTTARPAGATGAATADAAGASEFAATHADGGIAGGVGGVVGVGRLGDAGGGGVPGSGEAEVGGIGADVDAQLPPPQAPTASASTNARPRMHHSSTADTTNTPNLSQSRMEGRRAFA